MNFSKINLVYKMLRKYGIKSIFSKNFAILFAAFMTLFISVFVVACFLICNVEDNKNIEDYSRKTYASRNRMESILTSNDDISKTLINNKIIADFINDGTEEKLKDVTAVLEREKNGSGFLSSIYLYLPESGLVASTSPIYKSGRTEDFLDISWQKLYAEKKEVFYREYPDSGMILKCISHCSKVKTKEGSEGIFVYNVDYLKANMNHDVYEDGIFFMVNDANDILYCSDERLIGKNISGHINDKFNFEKISPYVSKWDFAREIILGVGMRKKDINFVFAVDKVWTKSSLFSFSSIAFWVFLCVLVSFLLSLIITVWIYRPLTDIFSLINSSDKSGYSKTNEINDAIEYIVDITKNKQIVENELTQNTILLQHAQIIALQLQLNPHFLFNSLQLLNSVILKEFRRDTEATKIVSILSQLLRDALDTTAFFKSLEEETNFAKSYIEIQNIRYENCFKVEWMIDENTKKCLVPKCILQPLLENSIAYGVLPLNNDDGLIRVKSCIKDGILKVSVWDNGVGFEKEKLEELRNMFRETRLERKNNIGLFNVNQRIKILFGVEYGIEINQDNGTEVVISLPAK